MAMPIRTPRAFVSGLGFSAHGWALGAYIGPTTRPIGGATVRLVDHFARHGPVSLVGFSLGGLFARLLAARHPGLVRQVMTVRSPIERPASSVFIPLDPLLGLWRGADLSRLAAEIAAPLMVPPRRSTFAATASSPGQAAGDPYGTAMDNIEVTECRVALGRNPELLAVLGERLAECPTRHAGD